VLDVEVLFYSVVAALTPEAALRGSPNLPVGQYGLGHDASRRDLHVFRISEHQSNPETGAAPY
jgi:hypothetical protein